MYLQRQQGFTLIEMIIVITIIAIIAAWAIPSFSRLISHQTLQKGAYSIANVFDQARAEAALSGKSAQIMVTNGNRDYVISFLDRSTGATGRRTTKQITLDKRLKVVMPQAGSAVASNGTQINVQPNGQLGNAYTFKVCDTRITDVSGYEVSVNSAGIVRVSSVQCP